MEETLHTAVEEALKEQGATDTRFVIEWPAELSHGDFATNAALSASKALGKNPRELADLLANSLRTKLDGVVEDISVAGPGFINFTLTRESVVKQIQAVEKDTEWGKGNTLEGKRVIIEYTDPNPFKEMHIGHLMSNVIGEATAGLIENDGAHVIRACYQGDVGPHVAKALWGLQKSGITEPATAKELGGAYALGSKAYEEDEAIKKEIDEINTAVYEAGDASLMELWRKGRGVSLSAFEQLYKILGTHFDYYFFESETSLPGKEMVLDGVAKGVFIESQGAVIYDGEKKGLHTLVFITSKGNPTYEAKDVGLAYLKEERCAPYDESIIITASEQIGHFKVFLAALEDLAPVLAQKTRHVPHGFLRLTEGKMSSREGNVITASELIADIIEKAKERNEDPLVAHAVAIGAIKYMILRSAPGGDIIFDPEKSLSLDGDSGPYLQYALVRAASLIAQASEKGDETVGKESSDLERLLIRFPEVLKRSRIEQAPHKLIQYLTLLASEWNSFYAQGKILGSEGEIYKLSIAKAFVATMKHGLLVLAIPTPKRM